MKKSLSFALVVMFSVAGWVHASTEVTLEHPKLILTTAGVEAIRSSLGEVPLFDETLERVRAEVDKEIASGIDTPVPRDFSGGYTHERHKRNFFVAQQAGSLFQILRDEKYAVYVRDMLFQYEAMYRDLPLHPKERSYARGKLFWQCLNDSNWLLYMAQAYDAIYAWLPERERARLNDNLFRPFADFISIENPQFFNRVHNHSTWGNAAVGMIGLVMNDDELVNRALYGINDDGLVAGLKDDDGGLIREAGQEVGFLANLEEPFSPDGYYTEGPYYQRYAMYPFLVFALAMHNARPDMGVLEYKDGVLLKAVNALLNLSDADGEFFPLNDAQKGMSLFSPSLVTAVNIAYFYGGRDARLLSIAQQQGEVLLDQSGLAVALAIRDGEAKPFSKSSVNLSDGPRGRQGGVAVLRQGNEDLTLLFKYAAQGLSHGHYDKLSFSLYDDGDEIIQDYGLVRFVNVEQKGGGNYLKENQSWAKQTIAHNTLVQNETSHFNGDYETGSQFHSELRFFDARNERLQVVSAQERNAYPGTLLQRTMVMLKREAMAEPFVLDVFRVVSEQDSQYDLPFYFMGQVLNTTFPYESLTTLSALGEANGYQHLYLEAASEPEPGAVQLNTLVDDKFYTLTTVAEEGDQLLLARVGANDPDFNLRRDAALIVRRPETAATVFVSLLEPHGSYSPVTERAVDIHSHVSGLRVVHDDNDYTVVEISYVDGATSLFAVVNGDTGAAIKHHLRIGDLSLSWVGPFHWVEALQ